MKTFLFILLFFPLQVFAFGWITDLHIGSEKIRKTSTSVIYPSKALKLFESYAKSHRGEAVLITGDITHRGKGIPKLRKLAKKYNLNLLLARGNHDFNDMPETFYSTVVDGCKLIVLDSNYNRRAVSGGVSPAELSWLEKELHSDLPIVIAMHHSVFDPKTGGVFPEYSEFIKLISDVPYVLSGHHHFDEFHELNGTQFISQRAFTIKKKINSVQFTQCESNNRQ